jgi:hypothetical protein
MTKLLASTIEAMGKVPAIVMPLNVVVLFRPGVNGDSTVVPERHQVGCHRDLELVRLHLGGQLLGAFCSARRLYSGLFFMLERPRRIGHGRQRIPLPARGQR